MDDFYDLAEFFNTKSFKMLITLINNGARVIKLVKSATRVMVKK